MTQLYYERYGDGDIKIIGFHGWGADHQKSFAAVIDALPDNTSFYGVDLPGYGESPLPDLFTYEEVTRCLLEGLDEILGDGESATVVGACSGSYHALEVARSRPDKIDRTVLVEPLAFYPWFLEIFLAPGLGPLLYRVIFDNPLGRLITQWGMHRRRVANEYDVMESFGRIDLEVPYRYLHFYQQLGEVSQYRTLPTPTRLVYGENTWAAVVKSADIWEATIPQLDPTRVEGVGHLVNQEAPSAVVDALLADR